MSLIIVESSNNSLCIKRTFKRKAQSKKIISGASQQKWCKFHHILIMNKQLWWRRTETKKVLVTVLLF